MRGWLGYYAMADMDKYLKEFEMYKEYKDIKDIIDEVNKLNELYYNKKYDEMLDYIHNLIRKYFVETLTWNSINTTMPQTIEQQYINANDFLKTQGLKILIDKGVKISKSFLGEK